MVNTLSSNNGWSVDQNTATGASANFNRTANYLFFTTAMLVNQGTGAFPDHIQLLQQLRNKDVFISELKLPIVEIAPTRTAAEDIERIRDVLSPGISTLADVFGVTRQTVYNWMKGERLKPEHFARLKDLAHAADRLAESGVSLSGSLLKRKVINGKNIFESVRDGGSAGDAAQVLIQIAQREQQQRELMNSRLAGRKKFTRSAESDFPAVNDGH